MTDIEPRKGKKRGRYGKASVEGVTVDSLVAAKQLVEYAGNAEAAAEAIGVLRKLHE